MSIPKAYRVYCYDLGRKAVTADFIRAGHDDEAVAKAAQAYAGCKCEIWDGKRLVAQLEAERRHA